MPKLALATLKAFDTYFLNRRRNGSSTRGVDVGMRVRRRLVLPSGLTVMLSPSHTMGDCNLCSVFLSRDMGGLGMNRLVSHLLLILINKIYLS